jgi:hypothetical protein
LSKTSKENSVPWYDEEGVDTVISYRENALRSQNTCTQRNAALSGCVSSGGDCIVLSEMKAIVFSMNLRQRRF